MTVDKKRKINSTVTTSNSRMKDCHPHDTAANMAPLLLLPVTLLGGFLGSGKTTLLKHILESKNNSDDGNSFKCAVIVNDVAELNIDKAMIDQSSFVQSNEVIAMQNGCVCCTLKSDLVDQIINMAESGKFDYMIIEASGISEPSEVAKIFAECDEDHDHDAKHGKKKTIHDVARLDTCVTVVDAADFFSKLYAITKGNSGTNATYAKLLVEQIEYSNVVLVNKTDLVSQNQIDEITEHIALLNPRARVLASKQSLIDVNEVVGTNLYNAENFEGLFSEVVELEEAKECCKTSMAKGESPCCRRARTIDSGVSQVMLTSKKLSKTRHEARFGISSFLYKARRPFHSKRFHSHFIDKYFVFIEPEEEEDCEEESVVDDEDVGAESTTEVSQMEKGVDTNDMQEEEGKEGEEELSPEESSIMRQQEVADARGQVRATHFGTVLRGKGFVWTCHSHDHMVEYGQAGNAVTLSLTEEWNVLDANAWTGTENEKAIIRKDFVDPWGDRRQELVFIGQDMDHEAIQKVLDECLLTTEELALGVDGWKATIGNMFLNDE